MSQTIASENPGPQAQPSLVDILTLEQLERNLFRGRNPPTAMPRVFGGVVIGQALIAAGHTVENRLPHSMHAYFMLPGDPSIPIIYEVDRIRDGKSFTTRRVVAIQHGEAIFACSASFHLEEPGLEYQATMPDAPPPESLLSQPELAVKYAAQLPPAMKRYFERPHTIEMRPVDISHYLGRKPDQLGFCTWMRAVRPLPQSPLMHQCVLAYASDMTLLDTAMVPHGSSLMMRGIQAASLDHSLWFHRPVRADQWLLYSQDSPNSHGARGLSRGLIFSRDGVLVASVAQEGLLRPRTQG